MQVNFIRRFILVRCHDKEIRSEELGSALVPRGLFLSSGVCALAVAWVLLAAWNATAQQAASPSPSASQQDAHSNLPDNPPPQADAGGNARAAPVTAKRQTKRILGIIPNFRAVNADTILPPQTLKEKFITTTQDSFDYSSAVIPIVLAGYNMARKSTPEFHQGAAGYGRYLWHSALDQTTENYFVEFAVPVLTHEDSRYYTLGRGGLFKRSGYAVSRAVVTRSDAGKKVFNVSELAGAGASASLSNAYYPGKERTFSNTATNWGLDVGIDAFTFVLKEFWPDVNHRLFHYDQPRP
jgi:hypothetical protein